MSQTKSRIALMAVAAILLLSVAFVPAVSAQSNVNLVVSPNPSSEKLVTGGGQKTVPITVTYNGPTPSQGLATATTNSVLVGVPVSCDDSFVKVTGPSSILIELAATGSGATPGGLSGEGIINVFVTASQGAKGLTQIDCTVTATSPELLSGVVDAGVATPTKFPITVDYLSVLSVKVDGRVTQAGPQKETNFPITITNFGNAQTRVVFQTFERPENNRWVIGLPDPVVLNAEWAADGKVDTVSYTIISAYKTGWNNDQGSFTISMKPEATTGKVNGVAPTGSEEFANVIVRVKGVHVPGFEPLALLAAVIGSALLARRNEEE
jgi:hypothetical protein